MKSLVSSKPADLRMLLHKHIARVDEGRHPWLLHASQVTKESPVFCPREAVLTKQMNTPVGKEEIRTALAVTFDWGHRTEDAVVEWLSAMGRAVGDWKCDHKPCGTYYNWQTQPKLCTKCGGERFKYRERRAWSKITGITSSVDLFVNLGLPKLRLLEIKSIDKDKFAELKGPLAEHSTRTNLYLRQLSECEDTDLQTRVDHQVGTVLYVSKGGYGVKTPEMQHWPFYDGQFSPFKTYDIKRNDAVTEHYAQMGRAAFEGMKGGPRPHRMCPVITHKRAQACPVRDACFKLTD